MEAYVKLENMTKIYRMGEVEIRAADGIDFEIMKGEFQPLPYGTLSVPVGREKRRF